MRILTLSIHRATILAQVHPSYHDDDGNRSREHVPVPPGEPRWPESPTRSLMQNEMRGAFRSVRIDRREGSAAPNPRAPDGLPGTRRRPSAPRTPDRAWATGGWRSNRRICRLYLKGALEPSRLATPVVAVRRSPCPSLARADTGMGLCHPRGIRLGPGFRCSSTVAASHGQPAVPRVQSLPLAQFEREGRRDLDPGQRRQHGAPGFLAPAPEPGSTVSSSMVGAALTTPAALGLSRPRVKISGRTLDHIHLAMLLATHHHLKEPLPFSAVSRSQATGLPS